MTRTQITSLRLLRGHDVDVDMADGSRIHHAVLVSTGGRGTATLWLQADDHDVFVAIEEIQAIADTRRLVSGAA